MTTYKNPAETFQAMLKANEKFKADIRTALGPYNDDAEPLPLLVAGLVEECERLERQQRPGRLVKPHRSGGGYPVDSPMPHQQEPVTVKASKEQDND